MKVLFGVSGGIAAYKTPEFVREFVLGGHEVEIIMTKAAEQIVSPLVLSTLAKRKIWGQDDFLSAEDGWKIPHITLPEWADVIVVAPCSAETLSNIAAGRAESLLSASVLSAGLKPVVVCPAMNYKMLDNPATISNISALRDRGIIVVEPESGHLACGDDGRGRLPRVESVVEEVKRAYQLSKGQKLMLGKKVLVTAGATVEPIDPVRFISNASSGKMGSAIAATARRRGAEVKVIMGHSSVPPVYGVEVIKVERAEEMQDAALANLDWADIIVCAAAVSDYRPSAVSGKKIKREGKESMTLELVRNPDIAAELGKRKKAGQILVGFALETDDIIANALKKMKSKNLDMIIANDTSSLGADNCSAMLIVSGEKESKTVCSGNKEDIANGLWDAIC